MVQAILNLELNEILLRHLRQELKMKDSVFCSKRGSMRYSTGSPQKTARGKAL